MHAKIVSLKSFTINSSDNQGISFLLLFCSVEQTPINVIFAVINAVSHLYICTDLKT